MARKSSRKVVYRRSRRMSRRGVHKPKSIGLIPAMLGGGAVAYPFLANTNGQPNVVDRVMNGDFSGAGTQFLGTLTNPQALTDIATLGALAAVFSYAGMKLHGANPHITKKVKVF